MVPAGKQTNPPPDSPHNNYDSNKNPGAPSTEDDKARKRWLSKSAIIEAYNEQHSRSDREFLENWNENLNSLLTFAGLLSAVVTAFIIEVGSGIEIKSDPTDVTNALLAQMLQHSGAVPNIPEPHVTLGFATQVRSLLYTSLSSSLLAAFGTLLTKEWVVHFRQKAPWIDTPREHCYVRELRFQGLIRWRFIAIMELLSILLQISLLFFGVGLFRSLQPQRTILDGVVGGFLCAGGLFYVITLLCGAIFPRCPFKTPVTEFLMQVGVFLLLKPAQIIIYFIYVLPAILHLSSSDARIHREGRLLSRLFRSQDWKAMFSRMRDDRRLMDRHMIDEAKAGVYFWAIQREGGTLDVQAAEESIFHMNKAVTKHVIHLEGVVHDWHTRAEHISLSDSLKSLRILGDVLFHGLSDTDSLNRFDFSPCYPSKISKAIRIVWGNEKGLYLGSGDSERPGLRPTTTAAYISAELDAALDATQWNMWEPSPHLDGDLTLWLKEYPDVDISTLIETFALVACRLVPHGHLRLRCSHLTVYGSFRRRLPWHEELMTSFELLSSSGMGLLCPEPLQTLLVQALKALRRHIDTIDISQRSKHWTSGKLSHNLLDLLNLSFVWSNRSLRLSTLSLFDMTIKTITRDSELPAVDALRDCRAIKLALAALETDIPPEAIGTTHGPSISIAFTFLQLLDVTLGIRYFNKLQPLDNDKKSTLATILDIFPTAASPDDEWCDADVHDALRAHPRALLVLASTMGPSHPLRNCGLSLLVKGKHLFFPSDVRHDENLVDTLTEIGARFFETRKRWQLVEEQEGRTFDHWEEARLALENLYSYIVASNPTPEPLRVMSQNLRITSTSH